MADIPDRWGCAIARIAPMAASIALAAGLTGAGLAQTTAPQTAAEPSLTDRATPREPVAFVADEIIYATETDIVTARGRVEASSEGRTLKADEVVFDRPNDTVTAVGHVSLTDVEGNIAFADRIELTGDLANGVAEGLAALLTDDSRLIAAKGYRREGRVNELERAVYSPCRLCEDDPRKAPLWRIRARKVTHDTNEKTIVYRDAVLEFFGVPVAWTPYFEHPDPTVKRRSGFLPPSFESSNFFGYAVEVPYFWNIAPNRDLTVAPMPTTDGDGVLKAEYRARTTGGVYNLSGSIANVRDRDSNGDVASGRDFEGHVFGAGRFRIDDVWGYGFDVERTSSDTYMRRFGISSRDRLTSTAFVEGFDERSYAAVRSYAFQTLRADEDDSATPYVLPLAEVAWIRPDKLWGGALRVNANALSLFRTDGVDTRRASLEIAWDRGFVTPMGQVLNVFASLRGDIYHTEDGDRAAGTTLREDGFAARVLPLAGVETRWPFMRRGEMVDQVIEPIVQLIVSRNGGNSGDIPNEDSGSFEFDETNLFSHNKFPGLDRWEEGTRVNLGVRWTGFFHNGIEAKAALGQSYRLDKNDSFTAESGLRDEISDIVGKFSIRWDPWVDLVHRFRIDREELEFRRNEVTLETGPDWMRVRLGYVLLSQDPSAERFTTREEVNSAIRVKLDDNWSVSGAYRHDIENNRSVEAGAGVFFENECLEFGVFGSRRYNSDRDLDTNDSIKVRLRLRNLG